MRQIVSINVYGRIEWICDKFENSSYSRQIIQAINKFSAEQSRNDMLHPNFCAGLLSTSEFEKVGVSIQLKWLIWRVYTDNRRNLSTFFLRLSLYMLIGLLLSTPYVGITIYIDQKGVQNIQGLLYLIITETIFTFNYAVFHTFPNELPLLLREIADGLYNPAPYYISKILVSIPSIILQPFIYTTLIYAVVGLKGSYNDFFLFTTPVILSALSSAAIGCMMSAVFESISTASLASVPIDFLTLIFSGIFLQLRSLPNYISWIKFVSQFYYGVEAISIIQWRNINQIDCSHDSEEPCISSGNMVLEKYGYSNDHYVIDCFGLLAIIIISHFVGFVAVKYRSESQPVY
ncbi:protein brown-like [Copidosoma floridanum]|uniref:protein brown-like n=1 Tax=Copidosoma floridanum TaxID=29053 RepID=UPI0006C96C0E|nr:protein brown-like [Copidosoma floridanum]